MSDGPIQPRAACGIPGPSGGRVERHTGPTPGEVRFDGGYVIPTDDASTLGRRDKNLVVRMQNLVGGVSSGPTARAGTRAC
ncbi:conserved hypothetical protein [Myxococcus xanthus DK 1622]|uniref:Uncharacterized protein n=1 Tax=Myxococcus xanthus (strain DK1622) TaxID=246197 RepID=Q1DBT6_MYXXD|nr:conserved hypothetical protein [Myxococcus xanthus DK 1622]